MSIERFVTPNINFSGKLSEAEKLAGAEMLKKRFQNQSDPDFEKIRSLERKKTPDELKMLDIANRATNALVKRYGGTPFDIPPENVHVLPSDVILDSTERDVEGAYNLLCQSSYVYEQEGMTPFVAIAAHEMIHAKSRSTIRKTEGGGVLNHRVGLRLTRDENRPGKDYFRWMNEAITEELTIRFVKVFREMTAAQAENDETEELLAAAPAENKSEIFFATRRKEVVSGPSWLSWTKKKSTVSSETISYAAFAYKKERKLLDKLIDALYRENSEAFKDRQEIFDIFARAMLSGNLLPLGRLIDRTFGPGSFRHFGNNRTDPQAIEARLEAFPASPSEEIFIRPEEPESADPYWRNFNQPTTAPKALKKAGPTS